MSSSPTLLDHLTCLSSASCSSFLPCFVHHSDLRDEPKGDQGSGRSRRPCWLGLLEERTSLGINLTRRRQRENSGHCGALSRQRSGSACGRPAPIEITALATAFRPPRPRQNLPHGFGARTYTRLTPWASAESVEEGNNKVASKQQTTRGRLQLLFSVTVNA